MHMHHLKSTPEQPHTAHHLVTRPGAERTRTMRSNRITAADAPTTTKQGRYTAPLARALRRIRGPRTENREPRTEVIFMSAGARHASAERLPIRPAA